MEQIRDEPVFVTPPQRLTCKVADELDATIRGHEALILPHNFTSVKPARNAIHFDNAPFANSQSESNVVNPIKAFHPFTAHAIIQVI